MKKKEKFLIMAAAQDEEPFIAARGSLIRK
jgi:hypothetical protein